MKKYIVETYMDKGGIGSVKVFDSEAEAVAYGDKEWYNLVDSDKKNYLKDKCGMFRVYEADYDPDDEDIVQSEYETREIKDYLRPWQYLKVTEQEYKALFEALDNCMFSASDEAVAKYYDDDTLTLNKGRNGKMYAWCIWSEDMQSCVDVDTLKEIDEEEIEKQLL